MATIIRNTNQPLPQTQQDNSFLIGIVILAVLLVVFFVYGLPYLTSLMRTTTPQVSVPGKVNINVQTPGSQGNTGRTTK